MITTEEQLNVLAGLAIADGNIADEERKLIFFIADGYGISYERTSQILENPKTVSNFQNLIFEDKFNYLFNIIRMMKIDGKVHHKEVQFCERLAVKLGFKPGVTAELSKYVYKDPNININRELLYAIVKKYAIHPLSEGSEVS